MSEAVELIGIFDADGGLVGEVGYALAKLAGRGHCALCDITHGWNPLGRRSWSDACAGAGLSVDFLHRNEASAEQMAAAGGLPAVLVRDGAGWRVLADADELAGCGGDPAQLVRLVEDRLAG